MIIFLLTTLTPILLFAESTILKSSIKTNPFNLTTFHNKRGDISIRHPEDWFIREYLYNNPYSIFLSREKVEKPTDLFKVGISIWKFYHQSWYLELEPDDADKSLNFLIDDYNKSVTYPNKKIEAKESVVIDGAPALREEISFDTLAGYRDRILLIYVMKDDVIVKFMCEAPETEFEQYREFFEESIKTAKLFSSEDMLPDNPLLEREMDQLIRDAEDSSEDIEEMILAYENAISMSPYYAKTRSLRGSFLMKGAEGVPVQYQEEILKEAGKEFDLAIELYNRHSQDYDENERKTDTAWCHFNKGMILIYESTTAEVNGLTDIYEAKQKEAIEEFKNVIEIDPKHPAAYVAYFNLGQAYKTLKEFEEALLYIQKTIDLMPDWEEAYFELGRVYYLLKQYDEAIASTEKGLAIKPGASAYNALALIYDEHKRDIDKAIECYQKAIAIDENNIEAYKSLGYIYGAVKEDYDKSIECYQKVIRIAPDYPDAYKNLGITYINKGDKDSASEQVKKLRELKRDDMAEQLQGYIDQME